MTILNELSIIADGRGYSGDTPVTVTDAIDAITNTFGATVDSKTVEEAIRNFGSNLGSGGSGGGNGKWSTYIGDENFAVLYDGDNFSYFVNNTSNSDDDERYQHFDSLGMTFYPVELLETYPYLMISRDTQGCYIYVAYDNRSSGDELDFSRGYYDSSENVYKFAYDGDFDEENDDRILYVDLSNVNTEHLIYISVHAPTGGDIG